MKKYLFAAATVALLAGMPQVASAAGLAPGKDVSMVLLPKFLGILPFDQAHQGAEEAAKELQNPSKLQFLGPTPENFTVDRAKAISRIAGFVGVPETEAGQLYDDYAASRTNASKSPPCGQPLPG